MNDLVGMQIFLDPVTRLPRLEEHDSPWQHFQDCLQLAGFHLKPVLFDSGDLDCADSPLVLLAASRAADALATFLLPLQEGS